MIHPLVAAKTALKASGRGLTNLKMNKVLYIAHMVYMGEQGEPLVSEPFEAWDYGPVLPSVYHQAKVFGSEPISEIFFVEDALAPSTPEGDYIYRAVKATENKTPGELVALTHWNQGAWAKHYKPGVRGIIIPNEDIIEEFKKRTQK